MAVSILLSLSLMVAMVCATVSTGAYMGNAFALAAVGEFNICLRSRVGSTNAVMVCGEFPKKATTCSGRFSPLIKDGIISAPVIPCGHIWQSFDFSIAYWAHGSSGARRLPSTKRHHSVKDRRGWNMTLNLTTHSAQVIKANPDRFTCCTPPEKVGMVLSTAERIP